MFWNLMIAALAIAPALSGVVKHEYEHCSANEFLCPDGVCISLATLCDGVRDCADGSDESLCLPGANSSMVLGDMLNRGKRQTGCKKSEWRCRNGQCISIYNKCDGVEDCADRSDETHALCRNSPCQDNLFRCTYGACVDGTAPCDGIKNCADNSDELLPRCHNTTRVFKGKFRCDNGQEISVTELCDGVADCADGSDETIQVCAGKTCGPYFQCAYGACVDADSNCSGTVECADGSDESDELCNPTAVAVVTSTSIRPPSVSPGTCELPPHPANGRYEVRGRPFDQPGSVFNGAVSITVSCEAGYAVDGAASQLLGCIQETGLTNDIPKCKRYCDLKPHRSVDYTCQTDDGNTIRRGPCSRRVFDGTTVVPTCRQPNYYGTPSYMHCKDGSFDSIARCPTGLTMNVTNITILVKDKVEVYISTYSEHDKQTTPGNVLPNGAAKPVTPVTPSLFNLDETDWRFSDAEDNKGNRINYNYQLGNNIFANGNNVDSVKVLIEKGKVMITAGEAVVNVDN